MLTNPVWLNGRILDPADATLLVTDHGITVGDGVFETIGVRDGEPVARTRHIRRLLWCAEKMAMQLPEWQDVEAGIDAVLAACDDATRAFGRMRVTWTSGDGPLGSGRGPGPGSLIVWAEAATEWAPTSRIAVCPWPRNERGAMAGIKTTSYAENVVALTWAKQFGADEAILLDTRGNVCEGTGSNIVWAVDGELVTPALSTGCLAGITRALVLQTSDVREAEVDESALARCTGAAVLSSTRDVHPVSWLRLSDGTVREFFDVDPLISAANDALLALYRHDVNP